MLGGGTFFQNVDFGEFHTVVMIVISRGEHWQVLLYR